MMDTQGGKEGRCSVKHKSTMVYEVYRESTNGVIFFPVRAEMPFGVCGVFGMLIPPGLEPSNRDAG